jgi:hypothetical protein
MGRFARLCALLSPYAVAIALELPLCPTAMLAGVPCPGCGITRATLALCHADVAGALRMNPLALVVVPASALLFAYSAFFYVRDGRTRLGERGPTIVGVSIGVGLTVVWALRWFGLFGGPVPI